MSVSGIEAAGFTPYVAPQLGVQSTPSPQAPAKPNADFGGMVLDGIERLEGVQDRADGLAAQAATGTLQQHPRLHDGRHRGLRDHPADRRRA